MLNVITTGDNLLDLLGRFTQSVFNTVASIGATTLNTLASIGRGSIFLANLLRICFTPTFYFKQLINQFVYVGFLSLPLVGLTTIFTGMALALQSYSGFQRFHAEQTIPAIVILSIVRELCPVLSGLMIAGRVGAAITAEISSMKISAQMDALKTLSVNPMRYLVAPRVIATTISMPILVFIADIIGVLGGFIVSIYTLGFAPQAYLEKTYNSFEAWDVHTGLIKATCFGFIVSVTACYNGIECKGGAKGVGISTTNTVVSSSIAILVANYLLTAIMF